MYTELGVLIGTAVFAAMIREYYGNKGMFVMPHLTDKGYTLGSLGAILSAFMVVVLNYALIPEIFTIPIAISLGVSWGIAAPDIIANLMGRRQQ